MGLQFARREENMFLNRALLPAAVAGTLAFVSTARVPAASTQLWQAWTKSEGARTVAERPQSEPSKKPCCFKNPAYAGTCKVQPAEDETCASILAYLNNPMAEGKSYCGGTTVRQGWTEVSCEEEGGRGVQ